MPSDTESDDACARWYGTAPVPKAIAAAWYAGRREADRPIPEGYLNVQQAATRFGLSDKHLYRVLGNRLQRRAAFPGAISVMVGRTLRWFLPTAEVEAYPAPRAVDTQQAVIDAIQTLLAVHGRVPTAEEISRHLGYKAGLVSEHLRVLKRDGIVSGDANGGFVVCRPQQGN